jgi:hypothetical protein
MSTSSPGSVRRSWDAEPVDAFDASGEALPLRCPKRAGLLDSASLAGQSQDGRDNDSK